MTHSIDLTAGPGAGGAPGRLLRALAAVLRARAERARREAAARRTLRILDALGPDRLRDIGLRPGDFERALRDHPRA